MTTSHRLGPVDMTVLTILAEQYGAPLDRVAAMLGASMKNTYRKTAKWRAAHMVSSLRVRPVPGPSWVFPTRAAVEALLPFYAKYWTPSPKMAAHVTAVLDVRLALVGMDLERWISERELRSQLGPTKAGVSRPHVHDGRFLDSEGRWWAVEVETPLTPGARVIESPQADRRDTPTTAEPALRDGVRSLMAARGGSARRNPRSSPERQALPESEGAVLQLIPPRCPPHACNH